MAYNSRIMNVITDNTPSVPTISPTTPGLNEKASPITVPLPEGMEYTQEELVFCSEFVRTGSAPEALTNTGYKAKNKNTLAAAASRMKAKPKIVALVKRIREGVRIDETEWHRSIEDKIRQTPDDEFKHDHWIKLMTLIGKAKGYIKDGKNNVQVGTMNLIQIKSGTKGDAKQKMDAAKEVIDVKATT